MQSMVRMASELWSGRKWAMDERFCVETAEYVCILSLDQAWLNSLVITYVILSEANTKAM